LGEGPLWHQGRKSFFWVDIEGKSIFEYNWQTQEVNRWLLDHRVSLLIEEKKDVLILALQGGIARLNLNTAEIDWLTGIEQEIPANRTNDGACDSAGRLWVGTMDLDCKEGAGSLYCIDKAIVTKKIDQLSIPNGIVWSHNDEYLYHIDSPSFKVISYLFDSSTGAIKKDKTIIAIPEEMGMPDGMTTDSEGMLWIAHWGGFGISLWNPANGKLLNRISVPAPNVTSCTFGGDHLDQLIITTARQHLSKEELNKYPGSGAVFIVQPGVSGKAANKFGVVSRES
jgi:sugar lactone lactonase YvrE